MNLRFLAFFALAMPSAFAQPQAQRCSKLVSISSDLYAKVQYDRINGIYDKSGKNLIKKPITKPFLGEATSLHLSNNGSFLFIFGGGDLVILKRNSENQFFEKFANIIGYRDRVNFNIIPEDIRISQDGRYGRLLFRYEGVNGFFGQSSFVFQMP